MEHIKSTIENALLEIRHPITVKVLKEIVLNAGEVDKTQKVIDQLNANGISDSSIIYLNHLLCKDVKQDLEYYDYYDGNQEFFRAYA